MDSSATAATIATTTPTTTSTTTTTDTTPTASANATTITSSSTPTPDPTSLAWSPIAKSFNLGAAYLDNFQIEAYLHALADMYPHLITLGTLGNSYEGRPLYYVRLTAPIANDTARPAKVGSTWTLSGRPGILMTSGMHAREWIAPSVILNLLDIWTAGYGGDSLLTDLLSGFEMIIVPMLNPDGYVWSWQLNRLWRKTTQLFAGGCMGVDLNRNFPASDWIDPENLNASSPDPCDDTFRGPYPGSAPETKALVNFVADYQAATGNMMQFVVDTHSYNLLWLYSFYDCSVAQSDSEANRGYVAEMAISAIYAVGGEVYTAGRICEVLYPTSGSTVEWAQEKYSISNSFAVELRDDGTHGFLLPPDQIVPSVAEINMGILTAIAYSDTAAPSTVV
ncbi:hypothetical protein BC828DRAFT_349748 [Blastocladiella britannica]|nr:hypothetical protein BC828DRAFT_349748 [Blastocladiella britannica]